MKKLTLAFKIWAISTFVKMKLPYKRFFRCSHTEDMLCLGEKGGSWTFVIHNSKVKFKRKNYTKKNLYVVGKWKIARLEKVNNGTNRRIKRAVVY